MTRFDVDEIIAYDRARAADQRLDEETETLIESCLRAIADKPHRAHLYLRDLVQSVEDAESELLRERERRVASEKAAARILALHRATAGERGQA